MHFLLSNKLQAELIKIKNDAQNELHSLRKGLVKQKESWKENLFQKSTASEKVCTSVSCADICQTNLRLTVNSDVQSLVIVSTAKQTQMHHAYDVLSRKKEC